MNKPSHYIPGDASTGAPNPLNLNYRVDFIPLSNGDGTFDPTGFYPPAESPIEFEVHGEEGILLGYTAFIEVKIHIGKETWSRSENCVIVYDNDRSRMKHNYRTYNYGQVKRWRETKYAIPGIDG